MSEKIIENNLEEVPFRHYAEQFSAANPQEIAARCGVPFHGNGFSVRLLDSDYVLTHPDYSIRCEAGSGASLSSLPFQTFLLRYLLEGRRAEPWSEMKTFRELPWGEVYIKPFTGRCITRAAYAFGTRLEAFKAAAARLGGEKDTHGDASYFFELLPGYRMELIVWEGDDEFPPNSQILYSSNFSEAFSAEDRVKAGDILITAIKKLM